jgi:predicted membrane-bound mannosyltransferase
VLVISALLTRPVTITRRTATGPADDYGNATTVPTTVQTVGELQQRSRAEPGDQGETSDTGWLLVLPAGTDLDTSDTVTIAGQSFEVTGDPWHARWPRTGLESHVEATLRRVTGPDTP